MKYWILSILAILLLLPSMYTFADQKYPPKVDVLIVTEDDVPLRARMVCTVADGVKAELHFIGTTENWTLQESDLKPVDKLIRSAISESAAHTALNKCLGKLVADKDDASLKPWPPANLVGNSTLLSKKSYWEAWIQYAVRAHKGVPVSSGVLRLQILDAQGYAAFQQHSGQPANRKETQGSHSSSEVTDLKIQLVKVKTELATVKVQLADAQHKLSRPRDYRIAGHPLPTLPNWGFGMIALGVLSLSGIYLLLTRSRV